jgi:PhnB protein
MAYDVPAAMGWSPGENAFFLPVRGETAQEITAFWDKLLEGATVLQPLGQAQWTPLYGMLKDQFGVIWVLDVAAQYNAA